MRRWLAARVLGAERPERALIGRLPATNARSTDDITRRLGSRRSLVSSDTGDRLSGSLEPDAERELVCPWRLVGEAADRLSERVRLLPVHAFDRRLVERVERLQCRVVARGL